MQTYIQCTIALCAATVIVFNNETSSTVRLTSTHLCQYWLFNNTVLAMDSIRWDVRAVQVSSQSEKCSLNCTALHTVLLPIMLISKTVYGLAYLTNSTAFKYSLHWNVLKALRRMVFSSRLYVRNIKDKVTFRYNRNVLYN